MNDAPTTPVLKRRTSFVGPNGLGSAAAAAAASAAAEEDNAGFVNRLRRNSSARALPVPDASVDQRRALQLMLVEMRDRAQHAEAVLTELTEEIARAEREISEWRTMMTRQDALDVEAEGDPLTAFLNGVSVVPRGAVGRTVTTDMTNAAQRFADAEVRIRELKAREQMLMGEVERDRWDKMRLLKLVDVFMLGRSAPTAGETLAFAKFGNAKSEALMRILRSLPVQNVQLLERQSVFKCIQGVLSAASQQYKRYGFVDLERVASQGVRYTGTSLGLSVIHDDMSEDDYIRL